MLLNNKVTFVTGAAQGIGKAIALTFAKYGADIVASDIKTADITQTVEEIGILRRRGL